jgi:co-chaperonin GroES (HSP10)
MNLDIDELSGLRGECDFIFSFSRVQDFITAPIFCITEAKKQDLEQGTIQCAAQLIGAKKFNEQENSNVTVLYGASTTGIEWRFLKYENNEIIIDEKRYLITDIANLLGIFGLVIEQSKNNLTPKQSPQFSRF